MLFIGIITIFFYLGYLYDESKRFYDKHYESIERIGLVLLGMALYYIIKWVVI